MMHSLVSIIIVNWNGEEFLGNCLDSLRKQSYEDFEIIFVDNASTDSSLSLVKKLAGDLALNIKLVVLDKNRGFAGGNNEGLKYSSGHYIALLNTDTIADKDWLKNLVEAMDAHKEVGICASKLIADGENVIDSAGDGYSTFGHPFKRGECVLPVNFAEEEYVFGSCAGATIYRREMIEQIGFFDEDFFLIFEDTDINFRAQLSGWRCLYVPKAVVSHKVGGSMKNISDLAAYYAVRNDKLVKIKNIPLAISLYKAPCLILGEIIWFIYFIVKGKFKCYVRANFDVLKSIPLFLRKRRNVMVMKKVSSKYIINLLTSGFRLYSMKRVKRYLAL